MCVLFNAFVVCVYMFVFLLFNMWCAVLCVVRFVVLLFLLFCVCMYVEYAWFLCVCVC